MKIKGAKLNMKQSLKLKLLVGFLVMTCSLSANAAKLVNAFTLKTEQVASVMIVGVGIYIYVKEDPNKHYEIKDVTINGYGLSKKDFVDILLSQKSSMVISFNTGGVVINSLSDVVLSAE